MQPDRPPEEELKPERIQDQILAAVSSSFARVLAALEWIETWARRLRSLFEPGDRDQ